MILQKVVLPDDLDQLRYTAERAFSSTPDAALDLWFSFSEMAASISRSQGICIKAVDDADRIVGLLYAQQENPVNGQEGMEKWVIILAAVLPEWTDLGIGSGLLQYMERQAVAAGAKKMFVFTNQEDDRVIHFYAKNGYAHAGLISAYQYGPDNTAVFLLKYL